MKNNIEILELRYRNILSVGNNEIVVSFEDIQNMFIGGENGAGKSTVLSALSFNLFGETDRGLKKSEVINNINKKDLFTSTKLRFNNKEYIIERGIKPDILRVKIDGEYINETSSKVEMDKIIVNMLGCDYSVFYKLVAISKTSYTPFMQMKTGDRRTFIENVLDIKVFSEMSVLVKDDMKILKQKVALQENDISNKENFIHRQVNSLEEQKKQRTQKISEIQANITYINEEKIPNLVKQKEKDIQEIKETIKNLDSKDISKDKKRIQDTISSLSEITDNIKGSLLSLNIEDINKSIEQIQEDLRKSNIHLSDLNRLITELNTQRKYTTQNGKNVSDKLSVIQNDSSCPTCFQVLKNDDLKISLEGSRNELQSEYKNQTNQLKSFVAEKEKLDGFISKLKEREKELSFERSRYFDLNTRFNENNLQIEKLNREFDSLDSEKNEGVIKLKEKLSHIEDKDYLYEANLDIKNYNSQLSELNNHTFDDTHILNDQKELSSLAREFEQDVKTLNNLKTIITILDDKGVKSNIIDMYIPFLNDRINFYLDKMDMFMYFEMDKSFKETLKKNFRFECSYNNLSEGEKQRVDLSIMFAFRDIAKTKNYANFNVLFLDDMTGHVDENGIDKILELIEKEKDGIVTVMINHDAQKYEGIFDKSLNFVKKNNFTTIKGD